LLQDDRGPVGDRGDPGQADLHGLGALRRARAEERGGGDAREHQSRQAHACPPGWWLSRRSADLTPRCRAAAVLARVEIGARSAKAPHWIWSRAVMARPPPERAPWFQPRKGRLSRLRHPPRSRSWP